MILGTMGVVMSVWCGVMSVWCGVMSVWGGVMSVWGGVVWVQRASRSSLEINRLWPFRACQPGRLQPNPEGLNWVNYTRKLGYCW